jgi:hypothetical protein
VTVRRYGRGTVVAASASTVTVNFPNGESREFLPAFVKTAPRRRSPAAELVT